MVTLNTPRRIAAVLAAALAAGGMVFLGGAASGSCGTGTNPGASQLNTPASFDYACQWAATPNTAVYTYANDSAGFASQLLTAGGMRPSSGNWNATNAWWSDEPVAGSQAPPQHSDSWASPQALYRFLIDSGNATELPAAQATLANTQAGDLIFWDWSPVAGGFDDVGMIVSGNGANTSTEMYAAHGQTTASSAAIVSLGGLRSMSDMLANRVGPYLRSLTVLNQSKYATSVLCPAADGGNGAGKGTCWSWHIVRPVSRGGYPGYSGPQTLSRTVVPSGQLGDDNAYLNGALATSMTATANGFSAGVKKFDLLDGTTVIATASVTCSPGCPARAAAPISVAAGALAQGTHTLTLRATDGAGATVTSAPWTVDIDRTAPNFVDTVVASTSTAGDGTQLIAWTAAADPPLTSEDAVGGVTYSVRWTRNGVTSGTLSLVDNALSIPTATGAVTVEVKAIDDAGLATGTFTVTANSTGTFQPGLVYRDSATGANWSYEHGVKHLIVSDDAALQNNLVLSSATSTSPSVLAALPTSDRLDYAEAEPIDNVGGVGDTTTPVEEPVARAASGPPAPGTYKCTSSAWIRSGVNKYVIGNCLPGKAATSAEANDGWSQGQFVVHGGADDNFTSGFLKGGYLGCGFIKWAGDNTKMLSNKDDTHGCDNDTVHENVFASEVADDTCVSTDCRTKREFRKVTGKKFSQPKWDFVPAYPDRDTEINVKRNGCELFANVRDGKAIDKLPYTTDLKKLSHGLWRYRAKGSNWVMFKYDPPPDVPNPVGGWSFINQNCLEGKPPKKIVLKLVDHEDHKTDHKDANGNLITVRVTSLRRASACGSRVEALKGLC